MPENRSAYAQELLRTMKGEPKRSIVRVSSPPRAELTPRDYIEAAQRKRAQREAMEILNVARSRGITPVVREAKEAKREAFEDKPDAQRAGPNRVWVEGFTRKDGTQVKGHWRKNPNPASPMKEAWKDLVEGRRSYGHISPTPVILLGATVIKQLHDAYKTLEAYTDAIRGKRPLTYTIRPDGSVAPYSDEALQAGQVLAGFAATKGIPAAAASRAARKPLPRNQSNIFIGPEGAENLAKAGLRHPDDWGGVNRLKAAKDAWSKGASNEETWRKFGWTRDNTWGHWKLGDKPATLIPDDRLRLSSIGEGQYQGRLDQFFVGADELFVAEPRSAAIPTTINVDPQRIWFNRGATKIYAHHRIKKPPNWDRMSPRQRAIWQDQNPPRELPSEVIVEGPAVDDALLDTLLHETQHTVQMFQDVPTIKASMLDHYLFGTEAERIVVRKVAELEQTLAQVQTNPRVDEKYIAMLRSQLTDLQERLARIPSYARYLDTPWERQARETTLRRRLTLEQNRRIIPGAIDTYVPDAFRGVGVEQHWGLPASAFKPPKK